MTTCDPHRIGALGLLGVLVLGSVAGCSASDGDPAASSSSTSAAPTATPSAASTSAPAPDAGTASPTSGPATCRSSQLRVRYADDQGGGAAGSRYGSLTFTNVAASQCAMTGWPGVSYVGGGDGQQLGAAADRTGSPTVVVLAPGQRASSTLREVDAGAIGGSCSVTAADGLRVYPPNTTAAVFVRHPQQACRSDTAHLLTIGPVQAG